MWIIGDKLLKESNQALKSLRTAYINDTTMPRLFIHDQFDVITHYEDKEGQNFIKQIRNNLAQLMAGHAKLPAMILIIISNEVLDDTAFAISQLQKLLTWLLTEIQVMIRIRANQLPDKCKVPTEPAVYLLKFLPRSQHNSDSSLFKSTRRKINNIIPELTNKLGFGFINAYDINTSTALLFDSEGRKLTSAGYVQMWESISHTIHEMIDNKRRKCKPITTTAESQTEDVRNLPTFQQLKKEEEAQDKQAQVRHNTDISGRRRLPPPPPKPNNYKIHQEYDYNSSHHYNRYHFNPGRKY